MTGLFYKTRHIFTCQDFNTFYFEISKLSPNCNAIIIISMTRTFYQPPLRILKVLIAAEMSFSVGDEFSVINRKLKCYLTRQASEAILND